MKIKHFCIYHLPFVITILFFGFMGCLPTREEIKDHKFTVGEIVLTKLGHERGMIVSKYIFAHKYEVRFSVNSEIVMQEYELVKLVEVNKDSLISELTRNLTEATNKLAESDNLKERVKSLIIEAEK